MSPWVWGRTEVAVRKLVDDDSELVGTLFFQRNILADPALDSQEPAALEAASDLWWEKFDIGNKPMGLNYGCRIYGNIDVYSYFQWKPILEAIKRGQKHRNMREDECLHILAVLQKAGAKVEWTPTDLPHRGATRAWLSSPDVLEWRGKQLLASASQLRAREVPNE